jgi:hypothetical protein
VGNELRLKAAPLLCTDADRGRAQRCRERLWIIQRPLTAAGVNDHLADVDGDRTV